MSSTKPKYYIQQWERSYACDDVYVTIPTIKVCKGSRKKCVKFLQKWALDDVPELVPMGERYFADRDDQSSYFWSLEKK